MKKIMSKYDFTPDMADTKIDYSELVTVPDQVLSMYDIYMKYSVRGEITGLANNIRPHVTDDLDFFDSDVDFVPEEDLDILQRSRATRMDAEASAEAKSNTIKTPEVEGAEPPVVDDSPSSDTQDTE